MGHFSTTALSERFPLLAPGIGVESDYTTCRIPAYGPVTLKAIRLRADKSSNCSNQTQSGKRRAAEAIATCNHGGIEDRGVNMQRHPLDEGTGRMLSVSEAKSPWRKAFSTALMFVERPAYPSRQLADQSRPKSSNTTRMTRMTPMMPMPPCPKP